MNLKERIAAWKKQINSFGNDISNYAASQGSGDLACDLEDAAKIIQKQQDIIKEKDRAILILQSSLAAFAADPFKRLDWTDAQRALAEANQILDKTKELSGEDHE